MGIRAAITGFFDGLRKSEIPVVPGLNVAPQHPISVVSGQGIGDIRVVDTNKVPGSEDVPGSWSRAWMGPGRPFVATQDSQYRNDERELEPRTFQYLASVNSTITPRIAYGLTAFSELKNYAEVVPEVALAFTIPSEELKSFIPTLVDKDGNEVDIPELRWMIEYPDRVNPWSTWLSRFLYNVQIYDAPALYKIRLPRPSLNKSIPVPELVNYRKDDETIPLIKWYCPECGEVNYYEYTNKKSVCESCDKEITRADLNKLYKKNRLNKRKSSGKKIVMKYKVPKEIGGILKTDSDNVAVHYHVDQPIVGLRIVDGSTIFPLVDERGEQPIPPAPAFTQVLWGVPRMFLNTNQLWYRPRFLRVDAPYGWTFIERSIKPVVLLSNLWDYEGAKYTVGNLPEAAYAVPGDWKSADQILEFEEAFNARMAGNTKERAGRARFFPSGTEMLATKEMSFNRETYDAARNSVLIAAGIPKSEVGEAPEGMLGGKSYAEAMNSSFYRMCISPLQTFVESAFNEAIRENGYTGIFFKLKFPNESIDPEKEEQKFSDRFTNGGITRNEYRESIGLSPIDGEEGEYLYTPGKQGAEGDPAMDDAFGGLFDNKKKQEPINVVRNNEKIKVIKVAELPMVATGLVDTEGIEPEPPKPNVVGMDLESLTNLAQLAGIDISRFSPDTIMQGLREEMEHIDTVDGDMTMVARIVADHLNEDPLYYDKLKVAMAKISGVDIDDEWYLNAPVTIKSDVNMPHQGTNHSMIVGIGGVGQKIRPAVWKPVTGEDESLQKWVGGELYRRSEAVYLLDRELAKDSNHYVVPVTWCDKVDGVPGSVQYYIQGRREKRLASTYGPTYVEHAAVLDFITGQVDRVNKNYLTHPVDDHRPILIDNDLSFPSGPVSIRSSFVDSWLNKDLSPDTLDSIYLILGNSDLWVDLEECVGDHAAVQGAKDRAAYLLEFGKIPAEIMQGKEMLEVVDQKG